AMNRGLSLRGRKSLKRDAGGVEGADHVHAKGVGVEPGQRDVVLGDAGERPSRLVAAVGQAGQALIVGMGHGGGKFPMCRAKEQVETCPTNAAVLNRQNVPLVPAVRATPSTARAVFGELLFTIGRPATCGEC